MLNGTIKMMGMLSRPGRIGGASPAQAGVGVESPLDDGMFNGASDTRWRRDCGRGRGGAAIAGLRSMCVFAIMLCANSNFLLINA